jgi:hypothetical protein
MFNEAIETFTHQGIKINIYQDEYDESPNDWRNEELFLVAFHQQFSVEREGFSQQICAAVANKGINEYDEKDADAIQILKEYHVFGLEAYIHSGVSFALSQEGNFPDRQWDVSQLGLVFVKKTEARLRTSARKLALGLIKTWNQYLSGEVYWYKVGDESLYGIYGLEYAIEEAKGVAEHVARNIQKKHEAKKKAEIKNHVPLSKRTHLQHA